MQLHKKKPTVLWVDHEPDVVKLFVDPVRQACGRTIQVEFRRCAESAWEFFSKHHERIIGVILRLQLPHEKFLRAVGQKQQQGETAVLLYQKMLERARVPVIFFVRDDDEMDIDLSAVKRLAPEGKCRLVSARKFPIPTVFAGTVREYFPLY